MRALVVETGGWGGICHYTFCLCNALAGADVTTRLLSGSPYELSKFDRAFELEDIFDAYGPYRDKWAATVDGIRRFEPDIVHVQSTFSARCDWALFKVIQLMGYPVVLTAHNIVPHDEAERSAVGMMKAYDLIYSIVDGIIVHGEGPLRDLIRDFRPDRSRVSVIPHGDYSLFSRGNQGDANTRTGLDSTGRIVMAFGAIREYKGVPELIDAFSRVADRHPDALLAIIGNPIGVDPEDLVNQVSSLGIEDRVRLKLEYIDVNEIAHYVESADLMVFPYRNIAQSGALQLAYAFAKPVLVTAVGAFPETVIHGENGLVVPPGDPEALAAGLDRLLSYDDQSLRRMGKRSAELAVDRHSWPDAAARTIEVYAKVLAG